MDAEGSIYGCPCFDSEHRPVVEWIARYAGSCVYGDKAAVSWVFGIISLVAWLGAQMPQIIANHKNRSVEGLSLAFLLNWFMGDFTNFVGCLLTHQLPFQTLLAFYYICVDLVLSGQYYYYTRPHRRHNRDAQMKRKKGHHHGSHLDQKNNSRVITQEEGLFSSQPVTIPMKPRTSSFNIKSMVTWSFLASFTKVQAMPLFSDLEEATATTTTPASATASAVISNVGPLVLVTSLDSQLIGTIFAWLCACLYLTSRLPQIYKNFKRKSTSGTSILLFMAALTGNTTYTLSILLSPEASGPSGGEFLLNELPFLLGAAGTVVFDITIFIQWFMYSRDDEDTFLPTTPHYHHTPYHHAHPAAHPFKYDILENADISDNELDDSEMEVAQATVEGESSDQQVKTKHSRNGRPLKSAPSIPLLPTHQDINDEGTPLSLSPQSIYLTLSQGSTPR